MRKRLSDADKAKREAKRARRAERDETAGEAPRGVAMGTLISRDDLVRAVRRSTDSLIADAERALPREPSCATCTAPKGCCKLHVIVLFHEALPIADALRRDARDTPDLRARLADAADAMETTARDAYRALNRPCVFLDAGERCTVYAQRPTECGSAFVFSAPALCSDPAADEVEAMRRPERDVRDRLGKTEMQTEQALRMTRLAGPYMGALPRMVLVALEAWDRADYADYLAAEVPRAAARLFTIRS